jgi:hypothetical protein
MAWPAVVSTKILKSRPYSVGESYGWPPTDTATPTSRRTEANPRWRKRTAAIATRAAATRA